MRASGILLPIFSLPSKYGIGTFGKEAFRFVDFLKTAGQSYWQILPLGATGFGDSPYQSFSAFAGNPYFIDLETLVTDGLLTENELAATPLAQNDTAVDYAKQYTHRFPLLRLAFSRFDAEKHPDFDTFCMSEAAWLSDYALFMTLKNEAHGAPWDAWDMPLKSRNPVALQQAREQHRDEIRFWQFLQFEFFTQWQALKDYANQNGIKIIGDMPIYVAADSVDVWVNPAQFLLDDTLTPTVVAGCPPDAFSDDGQLWGNPLYDWDAMSKTNPPFSWWETRLSHAMRLYDIVRIDHFRGFEAFYAIPFGDTDAKRGSWMKAPGVSLFRTLQNALGELPIIAEDLGFLTPAVRALLRDTAFPGMKVLQFAFDGSAKNEYLPHAYTRDCVVYTGTHDNDTVLGWAQENAQEVARAKQYLHIAENDSLNWAFIRTALSSVADTAILMMPDILGLDSAGRINTPSSLGGKNWCWRMDGICLNDWLAGILHDLAAMYDRLPAEKKEKPKTKDTTTDKPVSV